MGLIFDSSIFIADERSRFDLPAFLQSVSGEEPAIAAITASELLHGVERAQDPVRKGRRQLHVEQVLATLRIVPFDIAEARCHARIWAELEGRGTLIGAHDLQIAATALALNFGVATLNVQEFQRVPGLQVVDASPFARR